MYYLPWSMEEDCEWMFSCLAFFKGRIPCIILFLDCSVENKMDFFVTQTHY